MMCTGIASSSSSSCCRPSRRCHSIYSRSDGGSDSSSGDGGDGSHF